MQRINRYLVGALILLAIVFPTAFAALKGVLFAGAIASAIALLLLRHTPINRALFFFSIFYAFVGLIYSFYGEVVGAPGASRVMTVMVVYPLVFPLLAFTYTDGDDERLFRVFILSAWFLVAVDGAYLLAEFVPQFNFVTDLIGSLYPDDAVIDNADDYFKFTLPNVSSIIFLVPFVLSAFFSRTKLTTRFNLGSLLFLMSVLAILSARRALLLAFFVGPIVAAMLCMHVQKRRQARGRGIGNVWYAATLLLGGAAFLIYSDSFDFFVSQATSVFDFKNNGSNVERYLQFGALLDGINRLPIFGSAAGAAASYSRSATQPWAYELSYIAFIFQYGFWGFFVYLSGIVLLVYGMLNSIKREGKTGFQFFFLSGFISFLFANASNPYLAKFDYMWVIFVPFAILVAEVRKSRGVSNAFK